MYDDPTVAEIEAYSLPADYIAACEAEDAAQRQADAVATDVPATPAVTGLADCLDTRTDFVGRPAAENPYIIADWFRSGELVALVGAPKTKKSQLALQCGLAVASGRPLMAGVGHAGYAATRGRVLYANYELRRNTYEHRVSSLCSALGITADDIAGQWEALHLKGREHADVYHVCDYVEGSGRKFDLVIVDPLRNAYPPGVAGESFSENSSAHVQAVTMRFMRLVMATGATVLLIHHSAKGLTGERQNTDAGAGSGALSGGCDAIYSLVAHETEHCHILRSDYRSFAGCGPLVLENTWPAHSLRPDLDPEAYYRPAKRRKRDDRAAAEAVKADIEASQKPAPWTVERFAAECVGAEWRAKDTIILTAKAAGMTERDAGRWFTAALDAGRIEQSVLRGAGSPKRYRKSP